MEDILSFLDSKFDKKKKDKKKEKPAKEKTQKIAKPAKDESDEEKPELVFNERVLYQELIDDSEKGKHQKGMRGVLSLKNSLKWPDIYEREVCEKIFYIGKNYLASQRNEEIKLSEGENLRTKSNQEQQKKPKKKLISKNQLKQLEKIQASIEEEKLSLETVLKINKLWMEYCAQLMGRDNDQSAICGKILKADWTGAFLEVSNSTNKFLIGVKGHVIKETQRSFEIMNDKGDIKRVLKQGTVIEIIVVLLKEQRKVRVWLDNMMQRSHMRTKQKFKEKEGKLDLF